MNTVASYETIDGFKMAYTAVGDPKNPPLILVHGWTSHRGVWQSTVAALQTTYYCISMDLLGHGDSDKPVDGDYSIKAQADRIVKLADSLELQRFALIGHSMGGQIVLMIASLLAPERVTTLVDVSGVASGKVTAGAELRLRLIQICRWLPFIFPLTRTMVNSQTLANMLFGRSWFYDIKRIPPAFWQLEGQRLYSHPKPGVLASCGEAILEQDLTAQLSSIRASTLIMFGKQDNTVPLSEAYLAQQYISGSQLVLFDECGHFPMIEQPSAYLTTLQDFLVQ